MLFNETDEKKIQKKGIFNDNQLKRFFPRKYIDYSNVSSLSKELNGKEVVIRAKLIKWNTKFLQSTNDYMTTATAYSNGYYINLAWFHNVWIGKSVLQLKLNNTVLLFGKITYDEKYNSFNMVNADVEEDDVSYLGVRTVYPSVKGLIDAKIRKAIKEALATSETDYLSEEIRNNEKLVDINTAICNLHFPKSMKDVEDGEKRVLFDDLLYFATEVEKDNLYTPKGSIYQANVRNKMDEYISSLPYELTKAQRETIEKIYELMKDGRCVNVLVQGDVGCGKTTVAIASLILMAENGYQSVLMTPTVTLGEQHYNELKGICDRLNISVCFYGGDLKAKEKKAIVENVKNGNCSIIVGTQGVTNLEYNNLSLLIADEEHKYGVEQREKLVKKGVHTIVMSATPIPRSIATTIYGENKEIFTINELPSNRLPVKTCRVDNDEIILKGVEAELKSGHQIYVVCPLVNESDNEKTANVVSVKELTKHFKERFPNETIETISGNMKKADIETSMKNYKEGTTHILIATSIIEVGISVPNATMILIYNAERFGIAELHQLRGRVGRGSLQSYCVLISSDTENLRLKKLCETTDGFEIAKADLEQRGMGEVLGLKQSGKNIFIEESLKYPDLFKKCKEIAKTILLPRNEYQSFLQEYSERNICK